MSSYRFAPLFALLVSTLGCDPGSKPASPPRPAPATPSDVVEKPAATVDASSAVEARPEAAPPAADALSELAKSSNAFGFDLYQRVRKSKGNLVVSPASITTALTMTWGGAKGTTAAQMKKVLHLSGTPENVMQTSGKLAQSLESPERPIKFRIANRLFGEKTYHFEQAYLDATKAAYGAPMERLDFKTAFEPARNRINGWVEQRTEQRIKDLIPPQGIDDQTRLVLVNAIYFLGDWADPFKKERTRPAPFFLTKTNKKDVPTMFGTETRRYAEKSDVRALELGYEGGSMSMLLLVPTEVEGIEALEQSLDGRKLEELVGALAPKLVEVALPKFEVNPAESLALGPVLRQMGMPDAFDRDKADFSLIANPTNPADRLYISKVFHKAFVRVDEKGTEAAAASAVVMSRAGGAPPKPIVLEVNRPFLFLIRDNASGLVLFLGRVADPAKV